MRKDIDATLNYRQALHWIRENTLHEKGIVVSSVQKIPYLEVTGYLISSLMEAQEYDLAKQYAEFLSFMQRPNGSFAGTDGREYIFDSGQALRGLVCAARRWEEYKKYAEKTADYLRSSIQEDGRMPAIYNNEIPEAVHVYALKGLVDAADLFHKPDYLQKAKKAVQYYKNYPNVLDERTLTHFLMYIIDGFIEMGETDFIRPAFEKIMSTQKKNGSLSAYPHVSWACSVGLAQFAVICYKLKFTDAGDRAIGYLCSLQNPSGGFYGSYGMGSAYFPKEEISWANKFFIDAIRLKEGPIQETKKDIKLLEAEEWHEAMTDYTAEELIEKIHKNDFPLWVKPLLQFTSPEESILELGSGTGELAAILSLYGRKMRLLDYSPKSIEFTKALFEKMAFKAEFYVADILKNLPLGDGAVDWIFSSGVLEHFKDEQIVGILKDSLRVSSKGVISLVPNASSVFYRLAKFKMEKEGTWRFGKEVPKFTMQHYFEVAGLKNIKEFSIGTYHAVCFDQEEHRETKEFFDHLSFEELQQMNQGYLLFTIGEK